LDLELIVGTVGAIAVAIAFMLLEIDDSGVKDGLIVLSVLVMVALVLQTRLLRMANEQIRQQNQRSIFIGMWARLVAAVEEDAELVGRVQAFVDSAVELSRGLGSDNPASATLHYMLDKINSEMEALKVGQVPSDANAFMTVMTAKSHQTLWATSLTREDLVRWQSADWHNYWEAQLAAMRRGVQIRRIFIYDEWPPNGALDLLARRQETAGVEVRRVAASPLKGSPDRDLLVDMIIWDDKAACQFKRRGDEDDEPLYNDFSVARIDIARLTTMYNRLWGIADPLSTDEQASTPGRMVPRAL
jgi:hypothetical protein